MKAVTRTLLVALLAGSMLAPMADARPRPGRPNSAAVTADKGQAIVNRTVAQINARAADFDEDLWEFYEELDELLWEVEPGTDEDDILDWAFDVEDDLYEAEYKTGIKIDRLADRTIMRLTRMGFDPSFGVAIDAARDTAQTAIGASVMSALAELDMAVEEALAIAAQPVEDDEDWDDDDDEDDDWDEDDDDSDCPNDD